MPKSLFKLAAKGAAGFLVGLAAWLWLSLPYTRLLGGLSESLIRLSERPALTSVIPRGTLLVIARNDHRRPASPGQLAVESTDITFNFILLTALFATSARVLSDRNVFGFAVASVALVFVHVAAVIAFVKADYASNFGRWSARHYGVVARSFWSAAPYFYSIVGVYAFAFGLWWLLRPLTTSAGRRSTSGERAERRISPRLRRNFKASKPSFMKSRNKRID